MVFVHDNPAALNFAKPDGQTKVQRRPLLLLGRLDALHTRKSERDILSGNNLEPFDIECNRLRLTRIKQLQVSS